jgi:hypothetical protein
MVLVRIIAYGRKHKIADKGEKNQYVILSKRMKTFLYSRLSKKVTKEAVEYYIRTPC